MSQVVVRNWVGIMEGNPKSETKPKPKEAESETRSVPASWTCSVFGFHTEGVRYGANSRRTSSGSGRPAIWSLLKIAVESPNVCCVTFWNAEATCVLTCRYQWPITRAYACFTSAGTALVAVV